MRKLLLLSCCFSALLSVSGGARAAGVLYEENFDSLLPSLGDSVNERVGTAFVTRVASDPDSSPFSGVWSNSATGWTRDNALSTYDGAPTVTPGIPGTGVADYGVDEWEGWTFPRLDFWAGAAGGQDRQNFGTVSGAAGTVAVADPDEYFDLGGSDDPVNGGYYSASLISPSIPVSGGEFYGLGFDSSWRDEAFDDNAPGFVDMNNQAFEIIASFDVGGDKQVVKWNSDDTDVNFKNDAPDEHFNPNGADIPAIEAPAGATSMTLKFNIANAGNDWWMAIDNIQVDDLTGGAGTVFSEDFESSVTLGDSVNERLGAGSKVTAAPGSVITILGTDYPTTAKPNAFTHTPPAGMNVDTTIDAGNVGDNNVGVFEWEGWSFADPSFWTFADTQEREQFSKGTGVVAIADGDEWTDLGGPTGKLQTMLETPSIDLTGMAPGEVVQIQFDSSWRSESGQIGTLTALLDGSPVELFRWEGGDDIVPGGDRDRTVEITLDPSGASALQLKFSYEGGNNWWWAVDNLRVSSVVVPESSAIVLSVLGVCSCLLGAHGRRQRRT